MAIPTTSDRGITSKPGRWLKERIGGQNVGVGGGVGGAAANGNVIVNNHHNHYGIAGGGSSSRVTRPAYHHSARTASSGASPSLCCNLESMKQTILQKLVSTPAKKEEDLLGFCEWAMTYVGRTFTSHRAGPLLASSGPTASAMRGGAAGLRMEVGSSDGEGGLHHSNLKSSLASENGHSQPLSPTESGGSSGGTGEESDQSNDGNDDKPNEMHHTSALGEIILGENGRRGGGKAGNGVAVDPAVSSSTDGTASAKSTMTAANGNGKNGEEGDKKESSELQQAATGGGSERITGARTGNNGGVSKPPVSKSELETVSILLEFSTKVKEESQHQNGLSPRLSQSSSSTTTAGSIPSSSAWPSSHHINNHSKHGQQKEVVFPFPGKANGSSAPASMNAMNGFVPPPPQISPRTARACMKQEGGGGKVENSGTEAHHSPQVAPPAPISSYESQEMQFNVKPGALHKTTIGASCPPPSVLPLLHHNHLSESSTSSSPSSSSAESSNGHGVVIKREPPNSAAIANQSPGRVPPPPPPAGGGHHHLNHHLPHMHNIHPPRAKQQQPGGMMDVVIATQYVYYMQAGCPHPEGIRAGRWTYFHGVGENSCRNGHNNIFMGQLLGQEEIPSKVVAGIVRYNQDPRHNAVLMYYMPQDIFFLAPVQHIERLVGMEFLPEEAMCRLRDKVLRDWIPCPSRETETPSAVLPPHMYLPTPRVVMEASPTPSANGVTSAAGMGHHYHPPRLQSFPPPPSMTSGGVVGLRNGLVNGYANKHTKNRSSNVNGNGSPQVIMKAPPLPPPPLHHPHHHLPHHQQQQENTTGGRKGKQLSPPLPPSSIPNTSSSISSSSASSSSISSVNGGGGTNSPHLHHINHHHHHHSNTSSSSAIIQPRPSLKRPPSSPLHTEDHQHHLQQQQPKEKKQKQHMEPKGEEGGRGVVVLPASASGIKSAS